MPCWTACSERLVLATPGTFTLTFGMLTKLFPLATSAAPVTSTRPGMMTAVRSAAEDPFP